MLFETSSLSKLFTGNKGYCKPREAEFDDTTPLTNAIIYLERKAEEMELYNGMVNVRGMTRTEIDELTKEQDARVAPFRRAIHELKKLITIPILIFLCSCGHWVAYTQSKVITDVSSKGIKTKALNDLKRANFKVGDTLTKITFKKHG